MTAACSVTPQPSTADIPHPQVGDMQREKLTIDLDGCNIFIVVLGMNEFELNRPQPLRFDAWPGDVQAIFTREIDAWISRNAGVALRAITQSTVDGAFTVALHWRPKS